MKKILLTILLIAISSKIYACSCISQKLIDRYTQSDFIATVKILNIDSNEDYLNLNIEILELFKGEKTESLYKSKSFAGCGISTPENTKWLIFASKDKNGNLTFNRCSGVKQLDKSFDTERFERSPNVEKNHKNNLERKIKLLQYLKNENIKPSNEYQLLSSFSLDAMKKFKGYEVLNEKFALYELTIDKDLSVLEVKELKGFNNNKLDSELIKFIKSNIYIDRKGKLNEIPNQTKIILGLYYYQPERKNLSFIGTWAL